MNVAVALSQRRAASPYARRLARDRAFDLANLTGSGPDGRIVAADILSYTLPVAESPIERTVPPPPKTVVTFSAAVSLTDLFRLAADAARVGVDIAVEDAASRAANKALAGIGTDGVIAIEVDGRQIVAETAPGLSISAERRLRLAALNGGADASQQSAAASLLVLQATRVVPVALPLLPGRAFRFVLVVDNAGACAHALLIADGDAATAMQAAALLEAFVAALERPLALLA